MALGTVMTRYKTKGMIHEEITDNLDFIKIEHFHSVKDNVKRMRRQATD